MKRSKPQSTVADERKLRRDSSAEYLCLVKSHTAENSVYTLQYDVVMLMA